MVYVMRLYVDGGCRGNGKSWAVGAAAAVLQRKWGKYETRTCQVLTVGYCLPTSQRAEITAIILGLAVALDKYTRLRWDPRLDVVINSDSKYAVNGMNAWIYKWCNNGWKNARGVEVVNRDLWEKASDLVDRLRKLGRVKFVWIPRSENEFADELCDEMLETL